MSAGIKEITQRTGRPVTLAADGSTEWLPIGVGIAWNKVTAATDDTTLADDTPVAKGEKYLRYGTVLVPVSTPTVQKVTVSGSPTGGTMTISGAIDGKAFTTDAVDYNVSADDLLDELNRVTGNKVSKVELATGVYTITFKTSAHKVPQLSVTNDFTGGTTPDAAVTVTTAGDVDNGYWQEWDGNATLERGYVGILNCTIKESAPTMHTGFWDENVQGLIAGGLVWRERINVDAADLSDLLAAMPRLNLTPAQ